MGHECITNSGPGGRSFYSVTDSRRLSHAHCTSIGQYDKLRLLLRCGGQGPIVAIVELSCDLTTCDLERFVGHGIVLEPHRSCRWGLCVSDEWSRRRVGSALAPPSFEIATRFDRTCIIVLGGVHAANTHAIAYYRRIGFTEAGHFTNGDGIEAIDMLRDLARVPGSRGGCP